MNNLLLILATFALGVLAIFIIAARGLNAHDRSRHPFFSNKPK